MGLWLVYWVANRSGGDLTFDTHADGNVVTLSVPNAKCGTINEDPRETTLSNRPMTAAVEGQTRAFGPTDPPPRNRNGATRRTERASQASGGARREREPRHRDGARHGG